MPKPATATGIGAALQALRLAADLTLERASFLAGVSPSYLSRAESGEVQPTPKWVTHVMETIGEELAREKARS